MERVLILAATYPPTRCGVGEYVKRLSAELALEGTEVRVLTGIGEDPEHRHDVAPEDQRGPIPAPPPAWPAVPAPRFEPHSNGVLVARAVRHWNWEALALLDAALAALPPTLVNVQYHGEDYLLHPAVCAVPALAARHGLPTVTTLHNLQDPRRWIGGPDPLLELLRGSASLIATNRLDQTALLERLTAVGSAPRATAGAVRVIPAGPCITSGAPPIRGAATGPLRLFYFGFLNPFKGLEYLLRAVALLRDEGLDLSLTIAAGVHTDAPGRLRAYARAIQHEIAQLRLEGLLTRLDYVPDDEITRLLAQCELAVFPFRDGLSGKNSSFWGALHHATPALTTRGAGLPEGLMDGHNVLLAAADDARGLAGRIRWAMEHRAELPQVGERGRAYVLEHHGWRALARQTLEVFAAARAGGKQGAWA